MACSSKTKEEELKLIDDEIATTNHKICQLKSRLIKLKERREKLQDELIVEKTKQRSLENWSRTDYPWSSGVQKTLKMFKIQELRPLQLEAINATMSNQDIILIMPTGGGKSLCYQLPALLSKGITLVVSPLISLMEDQVMALKKIGIDALLLSASSTKVESKAAGDALQDLSSKIKLVYVTPERLAKSKRFMNQLQKCAANGRFARLAVDEVHCCSTWGHDFRPDYNYLSVLRDMFPKTPIIGLTATSSAKVTLDVQKMLNIEGCLILRAPFNRPNLRYWVLNKPDKLSEAADLISSWILGRFKDQTGIIYATSIKDCEDLAKAFKDRGIKVGIYHAMLDASIRSKIHKKWMECDIHVVVATIAFGLGIDKPDVRYVIHYALSKSMETFYQESGRAGRDGKTADCILLYRLQDVFKLSTMVFTQRTGLENLYGVVKYCLEPIQCRRSMIAEYFDESWEPEQCRKMCDNCASNMKYTEIKLNSYSKTIYKLLDHASQQDKQLTAVKLIEAWLQKGGDTKLRIKDLGVPKLDRFSAEIVVSQLLVHGFLKEDFHYTAYSTISYLKKGPRCVIEDEEGPVQVRIPKLPADLDSIEDCIQLDSSSSDNGDSSDLVIPVLRKKRKIN